jgi:hypothetical protein
LLLARDAEAFFEASGLAPLGAGRLDALLLELYGEQPASCAPHARSTQDVVPGVSMQSVRELVEQDVALPMIPGKQRS